MIREFAKQTLLAMGFYSCPRTSNQAVSDFLTSLAPIPTAQRLIRIGRGSDGGYLVPNDLEGIQYCFSPGVSDRIAFELDLEQRGIRCFLADASVPSPPDGLRKSTFDKTNIGIIDEEGVMTLGSWVNRYLSDYDGDILLQMDIEGDEYAVLTEVNEALLARFRIMVVEFHWLDSIFDSRVFPLIHQLFKKILSQFVVVHIHPNNRCGVLRNGDLSVPYAAEFTFLRRDRYRHESISLVFPHHLDYRNDPTRPELTLPVCWQKK
jgi:hypothetical protein